MSLRGSVVFFFFNFKCLYIFALQSADTTKAGPGLPIDQNKPAYVKLFSFISCLLGKPALADAGPDSQLSLQPS